MEAALLSHTHTHARATSLNPSGATEITRGGKLSEQNPVCAGGADGRGGGGEGGGGGWEAAGVFSSSPLSLTFTQSKV